MGLSLWIVPKVEDAKKVEVFMRLEPLRWGRLTRATSSPKFYPHITLASLPAPMENDLEAIQALIPSRTTPLKCAFDSVDVGNTYFQSVYIAITPSVDILDLHKQVHENLGEEPRTPTFPHLSLVYIADEDAGERVAYYNLLRQKEIIKEGSTDLGQDRDNKILSLNCAFDGVGYGWIDSFDAAEIWAVKCEGPVGTWQVLKKFAFVNELT